MFQMSDVQIDSYVEVINRDRFKNCDKTSAIKVQTKAPEYNKLKKLIIKRKNPKIWWKILGPNQASNEKCKTRILQEVVYMV